MTTTAQALPQVRVHRSAGQVVAPPPQPPSWFAQGARTFVAYAFGLWPLTGVVLLTIVLLWIAAMSSTP